VPTKLWKFTLQSKQSVGERWVCLSQHRMGISQFSTKEYGNSMVVAFQSRTQKGQLQLEEFGTNENV